MSITVKKSPSFSGTGGLRFTGNSSTTLLAVKQHPWTPAAIPGCILYEGAYQESRATRAEQPVLVDGDMEAAGVAAWILQENTALAKQGDPYAGLQCLRVTNAGGSHRYTNQAVGITGNRYRITGAARGDGSAHPRIGLGSTGYEWIGTTSNLWQPVSGDYNWTAGVSIFLYAYGADTKHAEFDSLTLANLSLTSYTPAYTTVAGSVLEQATDSAKPWVSSTLINGRESLQFANGDSVTMSGSKTPWKFLHDGSAFTHIVAWRSNTFPGQTILGKTVESLSIYSIGYALIYNNALSVFDLYVSNGSGSAWAIADRFAGAPGAGVAFVLTLRNDGSGNTTCWRNSTNLTRTRFVDTPSYSSADPNTALTVGIGADANLLDQAVYNRCLTDAEVTQIGQYMAAQWGITW